jgi:hypothetical protein
MSAFGRWNAVDPLADNDPGVSPCNYVENNPLLRTDPDGKSWITTLAKAGYKISTTVAKNGVGSLKKGATYADAAGAVKKVARGADEAGDAARSGVAEIRQHGDRHFSVTTHADESLQTELTFDATPGTASVQRTSGPGDRSVFVEVPDIDAAQSEQQSMIGPAGA